MLTKIANWAGMLGIALFYPIQDWQMFRTGDTAGLSLPAFLFLLVGTVGFSVLGWRLRNYQLMGANLVGTVFVLITLGLLVR